LPDHVRRLVRRQQADLPAQQRRGKTDREMIPIAAQIEDVLPLGQQRGQLRNIPQELVHACGGAIAVREHRVSAAVANQGNVDHRRRGNDYLAVRSFRRKHAQNLPPFSSWPITRPLVLGQLGCYKIA
jgi:hypothetical protein